MRWRSALIALGLVAVALAGGCGGDDESSGKAGAAKGAETVGATTVRNRTERSETTTERAGTTEAARRRREQAEQRSRRADEEFDREFAETPFEKLIARLPLHEPPLYVEQIVTESPTHRVHTRVDRRRFICRMSVSEREAAVEAYYRDADRMFREQGIRDFVEVVSPVTETAELQPALAVGERGSVRLTRRGRATGPC